MQTEELLRQIKAEDSERAFRQLFDAHYERLFRIAYFYLQRDDWAKEVALDIFASLWQKRKEMIIPADFRSFSYTMTRNAAFNLLEREQRHLHNDVTIADSEFSSDSPLQSVEQEELFALYQRTLDSLSDRCRDIFILVKEEGHTYAEVAELLHISPKTVDAQLQKALRVLRAALSDYHDDDKSKHRKLFLSLFL